MKTLGKILEVIWSLFVDDGSLAVLILVWCALVGLLLPRLSLPMELSAPILFVGLVVVLLENVRRSALGSAKKSVRPRVSDRRL
jgi:hypothetical protein